MTPDFNSSNENRRSPGSSNSIPGQTVQRDRFELLSAYIDGEVTAPERKQVEEWLATDPAIQRLHTRLLRLRQGFQAVPVPASQQSVQQTVDQVFARVERRPKRALIWGGAIAALAVGAVGSLFLGEQSPLTQLARLNQTETQTAPPNAGNEPLLVALDRPLVAIPKAPVVVPTSTADQTPNQP